MIFCQKDFANNKKCSTFALDFKGWKSCKSLGAWRSWLAHLHGVQGVESSSLFAPTDLKIKKLGRFGTKKCAKSALVL